MNKIRISNFVVKGGLTTLLLLFILCLNVSAQRLQVSDLVDLRSKSLEEVKSALKAKGWVYSGLRNDGGDVKRYCFNAGDGKGNLAAVIYLDMYDTAEQAIEYSVFRKSLIEQLQSSLKATAAKFIGKEPLSKDIELKMYEKSGAILVARGGLKSQYLNVRVQSKNDFERMQASR